MSTFPNSIYIHLYVPECLYVYIYRIGDTYTITQMLIWSNYNDAPAAIFYIILNKNQGISQATCTFGGHGFHVSLTGSVTNWWSFFRLLPSMVVTMENIERYGGKHRKNNTYRFFTPVLPTK